MVFAYNHGRAARMFGVVVVSMDNLEHEIQIVVISDNDVFDDRLVFVGGHYGVFVCHHCLDCFAGSLKWSLWQLYLLVGLNVSIGRYVPVSGFKPSQQTTFLYFFSPKSSHYFVIIQEIGLFLGII